MQKQLDNMHSIYLEQLNKYKQDRASKLAERKVQLEAKRQEQHQKRSIFLATSSSTEDIADEPIKGINLKMQQRLLHIPDRHLAVII